MLFSIRAHAFLPQVSRHLDNKIPLSSCAGPNAGTDTQDYHANRLCCSDRMRDSSREFSVVAGMHEQTYTPDLQDQELASLQ